MVSRIPTRTVARIVNSDHFREMVRHSPNRIVESLYIRNQDVPLYAKSDITLLEPFVMILRVTYGYLTREAGSSSTENRIETRISFVHIQALHD